MKRNKVILVTTVVVLVLLMLAGGAYTAVQLLNQPEEAAATSGGARVMQSVEVGSDGVPVSVQMTILPAPELPDEEAVTSGIVISRQDDTLRIGTGNISVNVEIEADAATGQETRSVVPSTDGPELEVVLTRDTILYRDVTDIEGQRPAESGEVTITQEVRPVSSADEIEPDMEIQVWGERRGDRIVADVLVFGALQ